MNQTDRRFVSPVRQHSPQPAPRTVGFCWFSRGRWISTSFPQGSYGGNGL